MATATEPDDGVDKSVEADNNVKPFVQQQTQQKMSPELQRQLGGRLVLSSTQLDKGVIFFYCFHGFEKPPSCYQFGIFTPVLGVKMSEYYTQKESRDIAKLPALIDAVRERSAEKVIVLLFSNFKG